MTDNDSPAEMIKIEVMAEVKTHFRPEFINRIDEIVVFHPLARDQIANIARIQLRGLEQRLAKLEIRLHVDDAALAHVAEAGFDPVYGARPLKRAIQQQIENPLAKEILSGKYAAGDTVGVKLSGSELTFVKS
jgi:ATP-dependent Clp protease ATP-binding subunit ClpB